MGAVYTATSKWNLIGRCQSLKPNLFGLRLSKPFIIAIKEMWHIEM